jgi:hypothetical protein
VCVSGSTEGGGEFCVCEIFFSGGRVRWEVEKNVERNIYESAHGNKKLFRSCFAGFFSERLLALRNIFPHTVEPLPRVRGRFGGRGKTEDMIESDRSMKRSRLVKSFSFVLCLGRGTK